MKFQNAKILIAVLAYPYMEREADESVFRMAQYSTWMCEGENYPRNNIIVSSTVGTSPARARQNIINKFMDETDFQSILLVGREYIFPQTTLELLYKADKDIIGGVSYKNRKRLQEVSKPVDTNIYAWESGKIVRYTQGELKDRIHREKYEPFEVPYVASGVMLVKRKVFRAIERPYFIEPINQEQPDQTLHPEIDFGKRARNLGFKSWIHPVAQLIHIGKSYGGIGLCNSKTQKY